MNKMFAVAVALFTVAAVPRVWAQEVYQKKEIAVFNLSYYNVAVPSELPVNLDQAIKDVFVNLGRFTVIGMTYRLGAEDVNQFIDNIKQFKAENAVIPEKVQMGQEFFTQADMNKLIGSFIVVIPSVASYTSEIDKSGSFLVRLQTAFSFVNVETTQTIAQFTLDTQGIAKEIQDAVQDAVESVPTSLSFEIRKIPDFQIKSGILEVHGSEVVFELGRNMGIFVGDQYQVLESKVLSSGRQVTEEKGLVLVRRVDEEVSYATVLYANSPLAVGDQLREIPLAGADVAAYARTIVMGASQLATSLGLRTTAVRGFYDFRPFLEMEVPLQLVGYAAPYFPFNMSLGGEYNIILGRLAVTPRASLGVGFSVGTVQQETYFRVTRYGGSVGLGMSYLFGSNTRFSLEGGYTMWLSTDTFYASSYGGVYAGGGISINF